MQHAQLDAIEIEGFKSFQSSTRIDLTANPGLNYIDGDNQVETRLGANGAGKSTFITDAPYWCLFNESVRGKRTSELVNWWCKYARVTTHWTVGGRSYAITRSGPPNKLLIDGNPAEQKDVLTLLKLSKARFLQSVIFGQAVKLFYDLSVPERGELFDEILDLGFWLKLSTLAGNKVSLLEREVSQLSLQLERLRGRLEGLGNTEELRSLESSWEQKFDAELDKIITQIDDAETQLVKHKENLCIAERIVAEHASTESLRTKIQELRSQRDKLEWDSKSIQDQIQAERKTIKFYEQHQNCPTCAQTIPLAMREEKSEISKGRVQTLESAVQLNAVQVDDLQKQIDSIERECSTLSNKIVQAARVVAVERVAIGGIEKTVEFLSGSFEEKIEEKQNPYTGQIATIEAEQASITAKIATLDSSLKATEGKKILIEYWKQGFKKVRLFLVKKTLAFLELETSNVANSLGLLGWAIKFSTEIETKSGTMKQGIQIQVSYSSEEQVGEWSPGEMQRVRLAISVGLSSIIQKMAGMTFGFCVFDEPTNWLSAPGIEDLLTSLKHYADLYKKQVWLIDHRALNFSGFDEEWHVTKTVKGSTVEQVS